jgi:hypothetical protein
MSSDECQQRVLGYAIKSVNDDQKTFCAERVGGLAGAASMIPRYSSTKSCGKTVVLFNIHFRSMKVWL